jgi:hypothetical protein
MIAAGTLIATPAGAVPVETLRPGATVLALEDGATVARPLRWVGRLDVDLARHPSPSRAAPVRLRAGAIAEGVPARDLLLSPDHALLLDGALFQAQALRNGASIAQDTAPTRIAYAHLELARHGAVLAEGLAVETYLDTGNRGLFGAGRAPRGLAPDLAGVPTGGALALVKARAFAPLRLDTATIAEAHAMAMARARALGWSLTDDAALTVLADGAEAPLVRFGDNLWGARLPEGTCAVRLLSRRFVPGELDPRIADRRVLGIAVRAVHLGERPIAAGAYGRGWHLSEAEWRWTDGDGRIGLRRLARAMALEVYTAPGAVPGYWLAPGEGI